MVAWREAEKAPRGSMLCWRASSPTMRAIDSSVTPYYSMAISLAISRESLAQRERRAKTE